METPEQSIDVIYPGRTEYRSCWEYQQRMLELRRAERIPDLLILTEHEQVYTIGRTGSDDHLLANTGELAALGVDVVHTDRGGDITFHGPGQLVGYPILNLTGYGRDLHRYLRSLEEVVIRTLSCVGVSGKRVDGYTGVWVGEEKICAIGIRSSRWVTMHGFAVNVSTDLTLFDRIIPCGIFDKGVTSLEAVLGRPVGIDAVTSLLVEEFGRVFGRKMCECGPGAYRPDAANKELATAPIS